MAKRPDDPEGTAARDTSIWTPEAIRDAQTRHVAISAVALERLSLDPVAMRFHPLFEEALREMVASIAEAGDCGVPPEARFEQGFRVGFTMGFGVGFDVGRDAAADPVLAAAQRIAPEELSKLTQLQLQVVGMVAQGKTHGEIAQRMGKSVATVRWHFRAAAQRLGMAGATLREHLFGG